MILRSRYLILLYLFALTGLLWAGFSHWAYDDPFITYRYAENLARGQGLVYNPGERVMSTTTPLFTLLLAVWSRLGIDLPVMANLIGAFGVALGAVFLWDLARTWKAEAAGWAALCLYPTFTLLLSTLGSETPLYLAFYLGAFAFYARQDYTWVGVMAALALLARGDGVLVAIVLGIDFLVFVRRPVPWRAVVAFLLITLPWFGFAWAYYGSPLPVTLAAKQSQGLMAISQRFAPGFLTLAQSYLAHWEFRLEAILAAAGLAWAAWQRRRWLVFFSWPILYFLAYTALGVSRYFWYYAPLVPGFVAAVGLGVSGIGSLAGAVIGKYGPGVKDNHGAPPQSGNPGWSHKISPGLAISLVLAIPLALAQIQNAIELHAYADPRYRIYREVGEWLRANTPPTAAVGMLEVGMIGYYAHRPVVDFAGLIQPEVAAQLLPQTTYEDSAIWAVERYHPAYLVLHERLFPRLEASYVARQCRAVREFEGQPYGYSSDLMIYACP